jgi:hypothetical protein
VLKCPRSKKDASGQLLSGSQIKVRLGRAAKSGMNLQNIIPFFDPGYSGRWNAGSNNRSKCEMPLDEFIDKLCKQIA